MITPFERWFKRPPNIQHLCVFDLPAYAHITKSRLAHAKLSDRSEKLLFVGYAEGMKAYRLIHPLTHVITNSCSVIFDELTTSFQDHGGNRLPRSNHARVDPVIEESDTIESIESGQFDIESQIELSDSEVGAEPVNTVHGHEFSAIDLESVDTTHIRSADSPTHNTPPSPKPPEPPHKDPNALVQTLCLRDMVQANGLKARVTRTGTQDR